MLRRIGLMAAILLLAILVTGCAPSYSDRLSAIQSDAALNENLADSAPKQTVAVLWEIRDLNILAIQQNTERSYIETALLGLLIMLVGEVFWLLKRGKPVVTVAASPSTYPAYAATAQLRSPAPAHSSPLRSPNPPEAQGRWASPPANDAADKALGWGDQG